MNWDAVGAIAEAVGAAGVIATLLYLGVQIRANTRSVRASTRQETVHGGRQVNLALAQDPEFSRIWTDGLLDFDALPRHERVRFASIATVFLHEFQNSLYQFEQGTLDQVSFENSRVQLSVICSLPGFASWWERNEIYRFYPAFEQLVDELTAEGKKPDTQAGRAADDTAGER